MMISLRSFTDSARVAPFAILLAGLCACAGTTHTSSSGNQSTFESPTAAVLAFGDVVGKGDAQAMTRLFGAESRELLYSGDDVADRADGQHVKELIHEKVAIEDCADGSSIALLGNEGWAFPIPLVKEGARWRFDSEAGREELTNRRVGRNELSTIATLHAYVDAQREYASMQHDGVPATYARRVFSSPGKHDGLYWPVAEGEAESPLGPAVAEAAADGYTRGEGGLNPFHGYRFRVLTACGKSAPGGAKEYVDESGHMTRGFALIAWPAKYGSSGVMTFLVDHQGIVYQKDLGASTESAAGAIKAFEVDSSWDPTGD